MFVTLFTAHRVVMLRTANSIQGPEDSGESQSRDHAYGETISPPAGLKDDWSYITDKNANKRAEHATRLGSVFIEVKLRILLAMWYFQQHRHFDSLVKRQHWDRSACSTLCC